MSEKPYKYVLNYMLYLLLVKEMKAPEETIRLMTSRIPWKLAGGETEENETCR